MDKCFTNLNKFYAKPEIRAQLGRSDHFAVLINPAQTKQKDTGSVKKRITRIQGPNEKAIFVHRLQNTDWSTLYAKQTCEDQYSVFDSIMTDLIDSCFPIKQVIYHTKDKPWVIEQLKDLVIRRQHALLSGNQEEYKRLRNIINRLSKTLKPKFYNTKVKHLKSSDSRKWWSHVKSIVGLNKAGGSDAMLSLANENTNGDVQQLAERINNFLHSVTSDISPLRPDNEYSQIQCEIPQTYTISVEEVERNLAKVKKNKSRGPDGIAAWIIRDLAPLLAKPIASIYNSSIRDGHVPTKWKSANICPLPKRNPPKIIEKDIRPISLTPILAKELERFVAKWIKTELKQQDPLQFGNRPKVSTTHLLVDLIHHWTKALDEGKSIQAVFLDFTKAFDKIDHTILLKKYAQDGIHPSLLRWIASFLCERKQCVKIGDFVSSLVTLNGAVPQGAILGLEAFLQMIKDMRSRLPIYKYVDDSTLFEVVPENANERKLQHAMNETVQWTRENGMVLNPSKTYEMVIAGRKPQTAPPVTIGDRTIERVTVTKLVGVHIQSDLKWDIHVSYMVSKASKKLHFLSTLKKSRMNSKDLVNFYTSIVRSQLEYAAPVFATSLPNCLVEKLESIQKRAMFIIFPGLDYIEALKKANIVTLEERRMNICKTFFQSIQCQDSVLNYLLPKQRQSNYCLRKKTKYDKTKCKTNRFKNSFIPYSLYNFQ